MPPRQINQTSIPGIDQWHLDSGWHARGGIGGPAAVSPENYPLSVDGAPLALMSGEELARSMRYDGATSGFRHWCRKLGIKPVPGRNNLYDPKHVRERLDAVQGMSRHQDQADTSRPMTLVEKRRARRAQK